MARKSAVFFRLSRFSPEYRSRLLAGLSDLQDFASKEYARPLKLFLKKVRTADRFLGQYVLDRRASSKGGALSLVKHALLGCQHLVPRLRGNISSAWENLKVWEEQRTGRLRPPVPVSIWGFMTGLARGHGKVAHSRGERDERFLFAVLLELGFLCLLRPGELFRLKHSDFAFPGMFFLSQAHAAVRVVSPKNRRHLGAEQFVALKNPNSIAWLRRLLVENSSQL